MNESVAAGGMTPKQWARQIRDFESGGDYFQAFEVARKAIAAHPDDESLKYLAVRALARSGAAERALRLYEEYGLPRSEDLDTKALQARLVKDLGLRATSTERWSLLRESAALYEKVYSASGDHYPAANAASLYFLVGAKDRATEWAKRTLRVCDENPAENDLEAYYLAASRAEANLVLGDATAAFDALAEAGEHARQNLALRAATRRQLRLVCEASGTNQAMLKPLAPPAVIHYTGHMIDPPGAKGRFPATREREVAETIAAALDRTGVGFAYGSLACGADILFAEACLARGIDLNVVLPFQKDEFKKLSVLRGGPGWDARFDRCLEQARSVTYATEGEYLGDEMLFTYGSQLAMGLAILRAQNLDGTPRQIALWDGESSAARAGTAVDVQTWKKGGGPTDVIPLRVSSQLPSGLPIHEPDEEGSRVLTSWKYADVSRALHAIMFGDVVGFSQVPERLLPMFHKGFMGKISDVLDTFGKKILYRNSWGDAIYAILDTPETGARCALQMQDELRQLNLRALGFAHPLELRLAVHYGPIFRGRDFLLKSETFFGSHVTRAARIEPVTPPGEVYVTEAMAAAMALYGEKSVRPEYVGSTQLAKNYGTLRMYVLRPEVG